MKVTLSKPHKGMWAFSLIPGIELCHDWDGFSLYVSWLFWSINFER